MTSYLFSGSKHPSKSAILNLHCEPKTSEGVICRRGIIFVTHRWFYSARRTSDRQRSHS